MKALIHLDQNGKKVMERRVHDAVMKERADISTRAQYVWALSIPLCKSFNGKHWATVSAMD